MDCHWLYLPYLFIDIAGSIIRCIGWNVYLGNKLWPCIDISFCLVYHGIIKSAFAEGYGWKGQPIIISTEKTPDELIKVDEALGSRIVEMCKGYTVVFKNAQNYRLR